MSSSYNHEHVVELYQIEGYSVCKIAKFYGAGQHTIKRILASRGVEIINKDNQGHYNKSGIPEKYRTSSSKIPNLKMMSSKLPYDVSEQFLASFEIGRLKILNRMTTKFKICQSTSDYVAFLNKFYFCPDFNRLYDQWMAHGQHIQAIPSLDHIVPISKGGKNTLDNVRIITWFENRIKKDMELEEWELFKKEAKLTSTYFI